MRPLRLPGLAICLLLVPIITGCWDRRELNELGISLGMGIDKAEDGYRVTVQVVQPGAVAQNKEGGNYTAPVSVYEARGVTIFEALRRMTTVSPRKIYSAHLRFVVFGEALAREGIEDTLDVLSRDNELRTDFYLLVAKGTTAANILTVLTPMEKIPANKIYRSIEMSEKTWAPTLGVTLDKFIEDLADKGKQPVLGGIEAVDDGAKGGGLENTERIRPAVQIRNAGLAAFREDKLVGWLNEDESIGYNYILNQVRSTIGHVECPKGGNVALETVHSNAEIRAAYKQGFPRLKVDLRVEQNIGEVQCRFDLSRQENFLVLERLSQRSLEEIIERTVKEAQSKYKVDIFGFGNAMHRSDSKAWKLLKQNWDDRFTSAEVDVHASVKIRRGGTIANPISEEKGE